MRRRSKAGPEVSKSRRGKAKTQKRGAALKTTRLRNSSIADHKTHSDVAQLTRERDEALEREKATARVLRVISSSRGDMEPVFQTLLENATRICEAKFGVLMRFDGEAFRCAAHLGTPPALVEFMQRGPIRPPPGSHLDHVIRTKQVSHTADYAADGVPVPPVTLGGARSTVDVPMLKDDELIGAFSIYRQEVRPFTEQQIALLTNFAAQAVIAIENARLLNELRESLQQQTATTEVLQVISSSPGELEPVFQAMLENAVHGGIGQGCKARQARHRGLEQVNLLCRTVLERARQSCCVAAGPREAGNVALADRIGRIAQDDGGCGIGLLHRRDCLAQAGHDDIDAEAREFCREVGKALVSSLGEAPLDDEILAIDKPKLAHALKEADVWPGLEGDRTRAPRDESDTPDFARLLRPRGERPRHRAADDRDEVAPFQLIEWHPLPQPTAGQHIALVRTKSGVRCNARCRQSQAPLRVLVV
jgi:hypothetical protein